MSDDLLQRYVAAEQLLPHRWPDLVVGGAIRPEFLDDGTDDFWFRAADGRYHLVEAASGVVADLFDHDVLARALESQCPTAAPADALELPRLRVLSRGRLRFDLEGTTVEYDEAERQLKPCWPTPPLHERASPDGRSSAFVRDHDVWLRELMSGQERRLTSGGHRDWSAGTPPQCHSYASALRHFGLQHPAMVSWSPDGSRLVTHRIDERLVRELPLTAASPPDGSPPQDRSLRYALPDDEHLPLGQLLVIDVTSGAVREVAGGPRLTPWTTPLSPGHSWWHAPTGRFCFLDADRTEQTATLNVVDPSTGAVDVLITEHGEVRVSLGPDLLPPATRMLSTGEVLWWSERDGYGHLYLYDSAGRLQRQLTRGDWVVRGIVAVDEADRSLVLAAGGREPGSNPYVRSLYRLDLDSATLQPFCTDGLDHAAVGSPSGRVVVDVTSGLGTPARSVLRRSTGEVVADLESADASALLEAGYAPPEPFVVKAADGITDLHGVLFRPHGFDPTQRWPVLDEIYPGPAHAPAPVRFPGDSGPTTFTHQPAFAALGFAVITLNSRGTPLRSRAFRDATRGNTYDEGLLDHVMALQQLHQQHPWLDLSRVGIYGASGGGHASARALMLHPETYRAAAAACGSHDERLYHAMWAERFVGSTSSTDYVAKDNASLAERMTGRLLLIHGELDDNVLPHLTVRLLDALMLADKDVDLLLVPNSDHDLGTHRHHWWRRRWDFLVRHVMGVEPPNYRLAPIPDDPSATLRRVGLG